MGRFDFTVLGARLLGSLDSSSVAAVFACIHGILSRGLLSLNHVGHCLRGIQC